MRPRLQVAGVTYMSITSVTIAWGKEGSDVTWVTELQCEIQGYGRETATVEDATSEAFISNASNPIFYARADFKYFCHGPSYMRSRAILNPVQYHHTTVPRTLLRTKVCSVRLCALVATLSNSKWASLTPLEHD